MNASRALSVSPFKPTLRMLCRSARVSSHWPTEALFTATWETRALKNSSFIEFRLCCAMLDSREVKCCCKKMKVLRPPFCLSSRDHCQNVLHQCFGELERRERSATLRTTTQGESCSLKGISLEISNSPSGVSSSSNHYS